MLLALAHEYSNTIALDAEGRITCNFGVTEVLLAARPEETQAVYTWLAQKMPAMWQAMLPHIQDNPWIQRALSPEGTIEFGVILVANSEIHKVNKLFRLKDTATDVLTFSLLEDAIDEMIMEKESLPELDLGEMYLSLDWAMDEVCKQNPANSDTTLNFFHGLSLYLLERLIHGCLHLLGIHHDTMSDYNKVVEIQRRVIDAITE